MEYGGGGVGNDAGGATRGGAGNLEKGPATNPDASPELSEGGDEMSPTVAEAVAAMAAQDQLRLQQQHQRQRRQQQQQQQSGGSSTSMNLAIDAAAAAGSRPQSGANAGLSVNSAPAFPTPAVPGTPNMAEAAGSSSGASAAAAPLAAGVGPGGIPAERFALMQQDHENVVAIVSDLRATVSDLSATVLQMQNERAAAAAAPTATGPAPAATASPAATGLTTMWPSPSNRLAEKAEFESRAAAWRVGKVHWALRAKRGVEFFTKEFIGTLLVGRVACTDKVLQQLKSMAGFNVLNFSPVGHTFGEISVADHFDLTCDAIMRVLKFGLKAEVAGDAASLARLQPLEAALLRARATFRMQLLRHQDEFASAEARTILADLPNSDFRAFSENLLLWVLQMQYLPMAPASFDEYGPPPVPAFAGVISFANSGSHLIRMLARVSGVTRESRKRLAPSSGGGGGGGGAETVKRQADGKVCFAFRDTGSCKWGDSCKFRHGRGGKVTGAGGGMGGRQAGGGGGAGGGRGGGGGSSVAAPAAGNP